MLSISLLLLDETPVSDVVTIPGNYTGTTIGSPTWRRPVENGNNPPTSLSDVGTSTPYHVQAARADVSGTYTIDSTQSGWDGFLCLYQNTFDPNNPLTNALACNDDGWGWVGTSRIPDIYLTAGTTYYIVTTGWSNADSGPFANTIY